MTELNQLRNDIDRNDMSYFNGGSRPVDDSIYDAWKRRLRELDPTDERLSRVGAPIGNDGVGKKARHVHPMGSLSNAMNEGELRAWYLGIWEKLTSDGMLPPSAGQLLPNPPLLSASFKADGGSAALIYKDGYLVQGITRGDGEIGEDITANVLRMQGVPRYVEMGPAIPVVLKPDPETDLGVLSTVQNAMDRHPFTGSVRGEIMLFNEDWKKLDPNVTSNPRNLGNGMSRRHDGKDVEHLRFIAFRVFDADGKELDFCSPHHTETGMLHSLRRMGFEPVPFWPGFSLEQIIILYGLIMGKEPVGEEVFMRLGMEINRENLPFEIDGLVIKLDDLALQNHLGVTDNRPKGQIAFKFPPRGGITELIGVEWTVGHTGAIIPTGILKPVKFGGVTVSRSLLCNMEEIERLGVAIGDMVDVRRQGDVIPKIVACHEPAKDDRQIIHAPTKCPVCSGAVGKKKGVSGDDSVHLYCLNDQCSAKQLGKIKTWVKKLDIQGLGDVFIEALRDPTSYLVPHQEAPVHFIPLETVADLYQLQTGPRHGSLVRVLGMSRAAKVLAEIEKKRELTLSQFLGCLGIDGLGRRRVTLVQQAAPGEFDELNDWTSGKLITMAQKVGLPGMAASIQAQIDANASLIDRLLSVGVTIKEDEAVAAPEPPKAGCLTFVLTGKAPKPKAFYHDLITAAGHRFEEEYSKTTNYLVAADPNSGSSKMKRAAKDGVPIITHDQLLEKIK